MAELNRNIMIGYIKNTLLVIAFIPLLAMSAIELNTVPDVQISDNNAMSTKEISEDSIEKTINVERLEKALKINTYFYERSMPLAGHGMQFVLIAEKYGLPYNFLPAIAIRESSGGKAACGYNPFGWGSCKLHNFSSYEQAIEALGKNLGGANPNTARYYASKSSLEKLYYYNGTVVPSYPAEVLAIMKSVGNDID